MCKDGQECVESISTGGGFNMLYVWVATGVGAVLIIIGIIICYKKKALCFKKSKAKEDNGVPESESVRAS